MRVRCHFNWKLLLFVVIFLPITVSLGLWQLQRAEEKRTLSAEFESLRHQAPVAIDTIDETNWRDYQPAKAQGQWLEHYYLLDNQVVNGKFGYEVLQGFALENGETLLVSRGFIAGSLQRENLPAFKTPRGVQRLQGYLYQPKASVSLAETIFDDSWPKVIQSPATEKLYKQLLKNDKISRHFILRLSQPNPGQLTPHWQVINMGPEKHQGYAVQWFLMAALLLIMFIYASFKTEPKPKEEPRADEPSEQ